MSEVADEAADSPLGARRGLFQPRSANIVAGFVLSLLLTGAGLTMLGWDAREVYLSGGNLPWEAKQGMCWLAAGLGLVLGLVVLIGGTLLGRYVWRLRSHWVEVYEYGFRYWQGDTVEDVQWGDLAGVQEIVRHERPPILHWPAILLLPKFTSSCYVAVTRTGKQYHFDGNSIGEIDLLGELLWEGCRTVGSPWKCVEDHV